MEDLSGQVIKGYELRELIGKGGFGAVYRAYQPLVKREVAIKIILPQYANHPDFIRRFEAEAQLVARLEHIHIVPLYDYWREPDGAYLVMRFLRGGSLRATLKHGPLDSPIAIRVFDHIASALGVAHRHGVVHSDLKPDNVLMDEDGNAYLADFGIAKDLRDREEIEEEVEAGVVVGSPSYISPEQITSEPVTTRSDIYSMGIVVYEIFTGETPFAGVAPSTLIFKHLHDPLPPLHEKRPDLPDLLDRVIQTATAKDPAERYPDMLFFVEAFHEALEVGTRHFPAHEEEATTRVHLDLVTTRIQADLAEPTNPYKGLRAFQEADAADFFGRAALIDKLASRLNEGNGDSRFLAVIGPSGSGKSSVVKAGLIPALRDGKLPGSKDWFIVEIVPGTHPLEDLEAALLRIAVNPPPTLREQLMEDERGLVRAIKRVLPGEESSELVLVIDQFEEVFTMVEDEAARNHLLNSLLAASADPRSRLRTVVTLRADFYDRPLLYPQFGDLIRRRTEVVLPLSPDELEQAIVGPAQRVGLHLEPGLVAAIKADIGQQPGALPLLQYALTELYERRKGRTLTLDAYRDSGGVFGALARRADEIYNELDERGQQAARQLFLRLVTLGEGTDDTRRRARMAEIISLQNGGGVMEQVVETFGKYRLLTFDRDLITRGPTVEVAHEALIRRWDRLRGWIEESREDLRLHRRLVAAAEEWLNIGKDPSFLASGARLEQLEVWSQETDIGLNVEEREYLEASIAERKRQEALEAARQAHERQLEQRSRSFLRALVVVFALATVVGIILSLVAFNQSEAARQNAATATVAQGQSLIDAENAATAAAVAELSAAEARSLAFVSGAQLALSNDNTDLAIALALQANQIAPGASPQIQRTLADAAFAPGTRRVFTGHENRINTVAYSPDGRTALTGAQDNTLILWDLQTGDILQRLSGHMDLVWSVAYIPDSQRAISASADHTLILWDLQTGEMIRQFEGHTDAVSSVVLNGDGSQAISGSFDKTLILWDVETGDMIRQLEGHTAAVRDVDFSAGGFTALSGGEDNAVILWNVQSGQPLLTFNGHTARVLAVAFSPDETTALSASTDQTIILWSFESGQPLRRFIGHSFQVNDAVFAPDGRSIVSGGDDNAVILWDVTTGAIIRRFIGHTHPVFGVGVSPDNQHIISGSFDETMRLWDMASGAEMQRFRSHTAAVRAVAFSPDGSTAASTSEDHSVILWDVATGEQIRRFEGHTAGVNAVAFSPDGRTLLTGSDDLTLVLWDVATGEQIRRFEGHSKEVQGVAISPDGRKAASGSRDNTVILWDMETGEQLHRLFGHTFYVTAVEFSPDGQSLATASYDNDIILWDVETGEELRRFEGHADWVTDVTFSADGQRLLSASVDTYVILWDVQTGQLLRRFEGHSAQLRTAALSPDGRLAFSGGADTHLILWDVERGVQLLRLSGHEDTIWSVTFSGDGRSALSGSADGTARLWEIIPRLEDLLSWTQGNRYIRELSCTEREEYGVEPLCPTLTPPLPEGPLT